MTRDVRTLLFSSLYPSSVRPLHGVFVETRLRELLQRGGVQSRVVSPIPWFWSTNERYGPYAKMARTPRFEQRHGVDVHYPRFARLPKVGMSTAPFLMALGARSALAQVQKSGFDFDVIDAHYYYPDGVAAALLALWFNKPLVVTARGTDVNLIPNYKVPRLLIQWAAQRAQASIGVSAALVERLRELGFEASRLHVMRNGVDLDRFQMLDVAQMRAALGIPVGMPVQLANAVNLSAPVVLTVGNLHEHKGQRLVIDAFAQVHQQQPGARLYIVGEGPDRKVLQQQAQALGLADAVTLVGTVPNTELARWYSAADVLVLASSREGWPNVLLEAMACGTPVVATRVGGVPEIVQTPQSGRVVPDRTAAAFAAAIRDLLDQRAPDAAQRSIQRAAVRQYAQGFGWDRTSQDQLQLFNTLAFKTPAAHT
jgi:teichuronic acid biosynthesis glycosyltransferase TuaC